jgi:phosphofructokinase-like protein
MRIAISTGGGDAPGLNAVIRAVVLSAEHRGWKCYGIQRGYDGLLTFNGVVPLGLDQVRGITHLGGTILGTSNRGNPFRYVTRGPDGLERETDRSADLVAAFHASGFDALVSIGGEGSLAIAYELWKQGVPLVCVPKTIDNDVSGTQRSFGFDTAVRTATEAMDKLHSTAESHERVMVVEVMGRYAGWIALHAGIAGGADIVLIPEIPFDTEKIATRVLDREKFGARFSIVVVAEGAHPVGGARAVVSEGTLDRVERLGGMAQRVARELEALTKKESRYVVLGHLQRGGSPLSYDRVLATRFGAFAVELLMRREFGVMTALRSPDVVAVPFERVVGRTRNVPPNSDIVRTARSVGISFGD